jgi:pimeloyl-ACP methyl ester carboxylesterase
VTSESEIRLETYIKDVVSFINKFKTDKRFSKIILLGHSEGSLIGIIAAEQTNVSAFISIAGAGQSGDIILQDQLKNKLPFQLLTESNKILDSLKAGKTVSNVSSDLFSLYRPGIQPYLISWIKYNPAKELSKLKIPVLIIQGTTDIQVSVSEAKILHASKPDAKLLIIINMNHILKESEIDSKKNIATYNNPDLPLKPGLMEGIVNFINNK